MDSATLIRSSEHPELISSHHWSKNDEKLKKSSKQYRGNRIKVTYELLPADPRNWDRDDVAYWLTRMSIKHNIKELRPERFLMNGKGLCLMTLDMYLDRVPLGGKLLYRDFQIRLAKAMYIC